jgi:DNA end-binding protein Ku
MRSLWTGAIGFGLVNIPVKLYSATESSSLDLDMLDKKDNAHIKFKRVNENTGKEVAWENIVKAYDFNGKYVLLTDQDFEKAAAEKSKLIEIIQFVKEAEINPIYYETPYYLEPERSGVKPYALLREALKKSGMAGLGQFVLRNKEHLCTIRADEDVLVLNRIRFAEEVRSTEELHLPEKTQVKPAELKMAMSLIDSLSGSFDIDQFKDNYTDALMKLIQAKAKGKSIAQPKLKVVHSKAKDLMEQLKESLKTYKKKAS